MLTNMVWAKNGTPQSGGSVNSLDITNLDARTFNMFVGYLKGDGGAVSYDIRFDNSSSTIYAGRLSVDGAADVTATSADRIDVGGTGIYVFVVFFVINADSQDKPVIFTSTHTSSTGAATAPSRTNGMGKTTQSAQFTQANIVDDTSNTYGSESDFSAFGTD